MGLIETLLTESLVMMLVFTSPSSRHAVSAHIETVAPDQVGRARRIATVMYAERILAQLGALCGVDVIYAHRDPALYFVLVVACVAYFVIYQASWYVHFVREEYATANAVQVLGIAAAVVAAVASPTTTSGALFGLSAISTIVIRRTLDGLALGAARARLATSAAAGSEGRSR